MPPLSTVQSSNAAWAPSNTPVGIFVGGTSGIGQGIVEAFARHTKGNAHIVIVGRNRTAANTILARFPKPALPGITREFRECNLSLIRNVKRATADILARFPRVNMLVITAGEVPRTGSNKTAEGLEHAPALMYYGRWAFIDGLLPALPAAQRAGEDARVHCVLNAGLGIPIDTDDLGLRKNISAGVSGFVRLLGQLSTYQDLMVEPRNCVHAGDEGVAQRLLPIYELPVDALQLVQRWEQEGDDMGDQGYAGTREARRLLWEHTEEVMRTFNN
ncbi:hypothetical protein C8R43DRAFT_1242470 [Mycena crocata]|nr:hypothetical protein C8R43DRAFT_1242470 [Mycena crocata]